MENVWLFTKIGILFFNLLLSTSYQSNFRSACTHVNMLDIRKNEESVLRSLPHAYVSNYNYNYIILSNFKEKSLANASVDRDGLVPC